MQPHPKRLILALALLFLALPAIAANVTFTDTYTGQGSNSSTCNAKFNISGQEPSATGTYPVFVYMVGTSETYTNASATAAVTGMANRGYVAATIQYDSGSFGNCASISGKGKCIFDPSSAASAVSKLCSRAKADCSKGIVVGGFSQGAVIATLAKNFDARVQAAWGMGDGINYSGIDLSACMADGHRTLPSDHLRAVNGQADSFLGGSASSVRNQDQQLTGLTCTSTSFSCFRTNGSGWYIVQNSEVQDGTADHCYMRASGGCFGSENILDSGWQNGTGQWSLNTNLDWLTNFTTK